MYLVAGTGTEIGSNRATAARLPPPKVNQPRSAWGDTAGNIYIADTGNIQDSRRRCYWKYSYLCRYRHHYFNGDGTAGYRRDDH